MTKNWIVTAVNTLTGEREQISQQMDRDEALAAAKKGNPPWATPCVQLPAARTSKTNLA